MDNLTAESAAVKLYAAMEMSTPEEFCESIRGRDHLVKHEIERLGVEYERICQSRIAAAVKAARVEGMEAIRDILETERNAMSVRQSAFERMDNADAVRGLQKDISDMTKRINAISDLITAESHGGDL